MKRVYALLLSTACLLVVMSDRAIPNDKVDQEVIRLPVRVHRLQCDEELRLHCSLSDNEIREQFVVVNETWDQANIVWEVESIVDMQAPSPESFTRAIEGPRGRLGPALRENVDQEGLLANGFNVVIAEDLGKRAGGLYMAGVGVVFYAKHGPRGLQTPAVLAHELGHALGLPHTIFEKDNNLMMGSSPERRPTRTKPITPSQITIARQVAKSGRPFKPQRIPPPSSDMREVFNLLDVDSDGSFTAAEAREEHRVFAADFMRRASRAPTDSISLEEFRTILQTQRQQAQTARRGYGPEIAPQVFARFDTNEDGKVTRAEANNPRALVNEYFDAWDRDKNGELTLDEVTDSLREQRAIPGALRNGGDLTSTDGAEKTSDTQSDEPSETPEVDREQEAQTILDRNDANGDGVVTEEEARPVVKRAFNRVDRNGDGRLELQEIARSGLRIRSGSRRRTTAFAEYDSDSDGSLSKEEVGASWRRLAEYDLNDDNSLNRNEYEKAIAEATERRREQQRQAFTVADADSDGEVSSQEFAAMARPFIPRPLFARSDTNGNDALDAKELETALARIRLRLLPPRGGRAGSSSRQQGGQMADPDFDPQVERPAFAKGQGPVVLVDEAHFNYHTVGGRYAPFAKLLRRDGYVVQPNSEEFTREALDRGRVLVISNALAKQNQNNWRLPTPSAFTPQEIDEVVQWVSEGGSLFLIADHMPMAGAAKELAAALDVRLLNGFALPQARGGAMRFDRKNQQLHDHAITRGRDESERIDFVATFTGSAFQVGEHFQPILEFGAGVASIQPEVAWQFTAETPRKNVEGWCQAAIGRYGDGRVAVFGEAAMFSAQRAGPTGRRFGMNAPEAAQNQQLLLNTMHWLTGVLEGQ